MTARKTDAERGPLGTWAYRTRDLLDLTVEVVAERIGASAATIRKIEGGSNAKPSARMLRDLYAVPLQAHQSTNLTVISRPLGLKCTCKVCESKHGGHDEAAPLRGRSEGAWRR